MPCYPIRRQHPLHHHLRRYPRVIRPRQIQRRLPPHTMPPRHHILQRNRQRMPHMQLPRNIRRRHNQRERLLPPIDLRPKIPALHPKIVYAPLHRLRLISPRQLPTAARLCLLHPNLSHALRPIIHYSLAKACPYPTSPLRLIFITLATNPAARLHSLRPPCAHIPRIYAHLSRAACALQSPTIPLTRRK